MIILKLLASAIVAFIAFQLWQHYQHIGQFDTVAMRQAKAEIVGKLGAPFDVYMCAGGGASPYNAQNLCHPGVAEVDAFETCSVPPLCPGWNSVAFDANGLAVEKVHVKP